MIRETSEEMIHLWHQYIRPKQDHHTSSSLSIRKLQIHQKSTVNKYPHFKNKFKNHKKLIRRYLMNIYMNARTLLTVLCYILSAEKLFYCSTNTISVLYLTNALHQGSCRERASHFIHCFYVWISTFPSIPQGVWCGLFCRHPDRWATLPGGRRQTPDPESDHRPLPGPWIW